MRGVSNSTSLQHFWAQTETPGDLTTEWALVPTSSIRTCHQRSQDNTAPPVGLERHSPDAKGAVGLTSLPESVSRPRAAGFPLLFGEFSTGAEAGRSRGRGRAPRAWTLGTLIHSSPPHSVPWREDSCPGCHRGAPAWPQGWGCCWRRAGGWPTAGRPPSAREPSCAGWPRWPCGYSDSRRWEGTTAPWGLGHSKSTVGPLKGGKTTGCHHCPHSVSQHTRRADSVWFRTLKGEVT